MRHVSINQGIPWCLKLLKSRYLGIKAKAIKGFMHHADQRITFLQKNNIIHKNKNNVV